MPPLYPTWFRWKSIEAMGFCVMRMLYIPHGSDESRKTLWLHGHWLCFISHMVQMKEDNLDYLYGNIAATFISHMVQMKETWTYQQDSRLNSLYPTWFRWKSACYSLARPLLCALYPTWFRWKPDPFEPIVVKKEALYPTWFRWKRVYSNGKSSKRKLYIPHGSDESNLRRVAESIHW